jgi:hypothetical protein
VSNLENNQLRRLADILVGQIVREVTEEHISNREEK